MRGLPGRDEAAAYYYTYIDRITNEDIVGELESQSDEILPFLRGISEERSLHRYAPEKWSIRQVINHVNDTERVFLFRALWFARGYDAPLPSFEQETAAATARADDVSWASHLDEFEAIRRASLAFFRNLPAEAWLRTGTASGYSFTARALAYITAGHLDHHVAILRERYL